MLGTERATLRTLAGAPWLVVGGLVVGVATLLASLVAAAPVMSVLLPHEARPPLALVLGSVASVLVVPPALSGLYVAARRSREREDRPGPIETIRLYVGGSLRHARDLTTATMVYRLAALAPAAVAFVLLLSVDTAVTYWQYAEGAAGRSGALEELTWVWLVLMLAGAAGRAVLVFYDLPVLFAGVSPRRCWRAALRFARRRPLALGRYAVVRLLLWAPMVVVVSLQVGVLIGRGTPTDMAEELGLYLIGAVLVGGLVSTVVAVYHVVAYERTVEPALRTPTATGRDRDTGPKTAAVADPGGARGSDGSGRRATVALPLAVLLVVAAAAGAGAVRITDERPMPAAERPVPEEASADVVAGNAAAVLANASYRSRMEVHRVNLTTGERQQHWNQTVAIDRVDRRGLLDTRVRADGGWSHEITYASETRTAFYSPGDPSGRISLHERLARRQAGDWTVFTLPGYRTLVDDVLGSGLPGLEGYDLTVRERTDERVVLAATRRPDEEPPEDGRHLLVGHVRMVVDADTGRPLGVRRNETFQAYDDGTKTERYRVVTRWTYADYGDPGVAAPDAIGSRGPVEWLWDYVYY